MTNQFPTIQQVLDWLNGMAKHRASANDMALALQAAKLVRRVAREGETVSLWRRKPSPLVVVLTLARAHDLPRPMVWLEDDGAISLDWDVASDVVLSVTFDLHGRGGGWSAIIGEWVQYDRFRDVDRSDLPSVLHRFAQVVVGA